MMLQNQDRMMLILIFIFLALILFFSNISPSNRQPEWMKVDMWKSVSNEEKELFKRLNIDCKWLKDAQGCKLGKYTLFAPTDESINILHIGRNNKAFVYFDPEILTIFSDSHDVLLQLTDKNRDGTYDGFSYSGRDPKAQIEIENMDWDLDGQIDAQIKYSEKDKKRTTLHRIDNEWYEFVKQDDRYGYVVDGKFYQMAEAKLKILERNKLLRKASQNR